MPIRSTSSVWIQNWYRVLAAFIRKKTGIGTPSTASGR